MLEETWSTAVLLLVQLLSCVQLFTTPWTVACQTSLSFSQTVFRLMSIEVVMPSNYLILSPPSLPAFNLSQHQSLLQWVNSSHQAAKMLELQHESLTDLISLLSKGLLMSLLQYHSSKASMLWHSAFFMIQLSHPYMTTGKTIALIV